jgi:hypothetical protein
MKSGLSLVGLSALAIGLAGAAFAQDSAKAPFIAKSSEIRTYMRLTKLIRKFQPNFL